MRQFGGRGARMREACGTEGTNTTRDEQLARFHPLPNAFHTAKRRVVSAEVANCVPCQRSRR